MFVVLSRIRAAKFVCLNGCLSTGREKLTKKLESYCKKNGPKISYVYGVVKNQGCKICLLKQMLEYGAGKTNKKVRISLQRPAAVSISFHFSLHTYIKHNYQILFEKILSVKARMDSVTVFLFVADSALSCVQCFSPDYLFTMSEGRITYSMLQDE